MTRFLKYFSDDKFKLRIALSRFNKGCLGQELEDKLIDYVISLESILIGSSGPDLKLRFALRGVSLLGNIQEERFEVVTRLANAYDARNRLVHGSFKEISLKSILILYPYIWSCDT